MSVSLIVADAVLGMGATRAGEHDRGTCREGLGVDLDIGRTAESRWLPVLWFSEERSVTHSRLRRFAYMLRDGPTQIDMKHITARMMFGTKTRLERPQGVWRLLWRLLKSDFAVLLE